VNDAEPIPPKALRRAMELLTMLADDDLGAARQTAQTLTDELLASDEPGVELREQLLAGASLARVNLEALASLTGQTVGDVLATLGRTAAGDPEAS